MDMLKGFDPTSPEFRANPYPYYDFLRMGMPIFYLADWNMWFCTRYEDCTALMRDSRLGLEILRVKTREELGFMPKEAIPEKRQHLMRSQYNWMVFRDPPDHTRLRGLVHKAFTPKMIEQLRGRITAIANDLLDEVKDKGEMDLVEDFAVPLPVIVIAEMLGVPMEDQAQFREWSRAMAGTLDLLGNDFDRVYDDAADAAIEFAAYFKDLADKRRADPQDDLLTALVEAEEEGDRLTEDELISTITFLLVAGHETTVNLIGNGTLALLRNPDQFDLLKSDPETHIKSAIEEMLRYDSPVQMTARWVLDDVERDGNRFEVGHRVAIMFAAANRDPERFENPNTFDITRENNKHLAFGNGIHFCLGAPLARVEAHTAFTLLCERLPKLQLAMENPPYRKTYLLRGLQSLPVTF